MGRIRRYLREVATALRIGAGPLDGARLAWATLAFHLGNLRGDPRGARGPSPPRRYRVRLAGRPQDLWLRTRGGDLFVLHEVFLSRCYDVPGFDASGAGTIVDLGANVGLASLYLATRAPRARLVCVEPSPANAGLLRRNLAALPNATVVEAAVAAGSGPVAFDDGHPAWGGRLAAHGPTLVRGLSMDDLLRETLPVGRVDLLKVDIEGAERELFAGDTGWLDRVDRIVAELHPPYAFEEFRALLAGRGFAVHGAGEGGFPMPTAIRLGLP